MGSSLLRKNIIAKAQNIFLKRIYELDRRLHLDSVYRSLHINRIVEGCLSSINLLHIGNDPLRFRVCNLLLLAGALIFIMDCQRWI